MRRTDGVRTLDDIRGRCVIEDETGCWLWRMAFSINSSGRGQPTTRVWLPPGVCGAGSRTGTASRAAWLLDRRNLPAGHLVWRHVCRSPECVNPAHGRAGTRSEMHEAFVADGRLRGDPVRAAINTRNRQSMLVPVGVVRRGEAMFAAGRLQKDVQAELGISANSAAKIRKGLHPNSAGAVRCVANASVFAWRAAA